MTLQEFVDEGYLQELNRRFLHPLGLAISVKCKGDFVFDFGDVQDHRDDPEGMMFPDFEPHELARAERIQRLFDEKADIRREKFGWVVQPLVLPCKTCHCMGRIPSESSMNARYRPCPDCKGKGRIE